jgi:hypothetical protein
VYLGYNKVTKDDVAIKVIDKKFLGTTGARYLAEEVRFAF